MRFLKYLLYILLVFVAIGVVLGFVGPKTYSISRDKVIAASAEQIWPYVTSFKKSASWTPWSRMDNTMTAEYSGEDGTVGAKLSWKSKKMGGGEQTITALDPYKSADSDLKFLQPWGEGHATSYFHLQDTIGGTKVTWGIEGENGFINRAMAALMNMDKMMGPIFMNGLNNLDSVIATLPKMPAIQINTEDYPGGKYLGVRSQVKISGLSDFFSNSFSKVMAGIKASKAEMDGMASGLYFTWDPQKDMTEMAAAIPIKQEVKAPAGLSLITLPASRALTIDYFGGYGGLGKAHNVMEEYITSNQLSQIPPVIEEYLVDPMMEKDSTKWHTRLVYFIK
jgi:effector-binding domain-containing protein